MKTIKKTTRYGVALSIAFFTMACGTASLSGESISGEGNGAGIGEVAGNDTAAAAVAQVFSSGGPAGSLSSLKALGLKMIDPTLPDPACQAVEEGDIDDAIETAGYVAEGEYGSILDTLDVAEGDSCTDSSGIANNGSGPDGLGLVAGFTLVGDVEGTCSDNEVGDYTVAMQPGSAGAFRDTVINLSTGEMETHVWGSFVFLVDGLNYEVDCSLQFDHDGQVLAATCTDESGEEIAQDDATNCEFHTEDALADDDYDPQDNNDQPEEDEDDENEEEGEEGQGPEGDDEEDHDHDEEEEE